MMQYQLSLFLAEREGERLVQQQQEEGGGEEGGGCCERGRVKGEEEVGGNGEPSENDFALCSPILRRF